MCNRFGSVRNPIIAIHLQKICMAKMTEVVKNYLRDQRNDWNPMTEFYRQKSKNSSKSAIFCPKIGLKSKTSKLFGCWLWWFGWQKKWDGGVNWGWTMESPRWFNLCVCVCMCVCVCACVCLCVCVGVCLAVFVRFRGQSMHLNPLYWWLSSS